MSYSQDKLIMSLNTILWFGKQLEVVRKDGRWLIVQGDKKTTFKEYQNQHLDSGSDAMYTNNEDN